MSWVFTNKPNPRAAMPRIGLARSSPASRLKNLRPLVTPMYPTIPNNKRTAPPTCRNRVGRFSLLIVIHFPPSPAMTERAVRVYRSEPLLEQSSFQRHQLLRPPWPDFGQHKPPRCRFD